MVQIVFLLGMCAVAAWNFANGATFRRWRSMRRLRSAEIVPIAALPENTAGRLVGTVTELEEVLIAPLSGRKCVYYEVKVIRENKSKTILIHERRAVRFALVDGSARAFVDPRYAELALDLDQQTSSGFLDDPTPREAALLQRHDQTSQGWLFNKGIIYQESIIEIGETVAVYGAGVREPDPAVTPIATDDYRGALPTRLLVSGTKDVPLVISDKASSTR